MASFYFNYLKMNKFLMHMCYFYPMKKMFAILLLIFLCASFRPTAYAQCAMCTANAEMGVKNGNTQTKGLNSGVIYLLAIPFLLVSTVGVVWYRNYRAK